MNPDHRPHPHEQVPPPPPPEDAVASEVPWSFLDAAGVFLVAFLVLGVLSPLLTAVVDAELARGLFFPLSLAALGATTLVWVRVRFPGAVGLLLRRRPSAADVGMGIAHGLVAFLVINFGFSLVLQLVASLTGMELPEVQQGLREATMDGRIGFLVIFSVVAVAPVAEEVYFRGLLFQGLRRGLGVWPAIGGSALLFGLAHYESGNIAGSLYAMVVLCSLGAYLAWALQRRSLVTPITMHATFNALALVLILVGS